MKFEEILVEAMVLVPEADIVEFMQRKSGRFRFPMYINEKLNNKREFTASEMRGIKNKCELSTDRFMVIFFPEECESFSQV